MGKDKDKDDLIHARARTEVLAKLRRRWRQRGLWQGMRAPSPKAGALRGIYPERTGNMCHATKRARTEVLAHLRRHRRQVSKA